MNRGSIVGIPVNRAEVANVIISPRTSRDTEIIPTNITATPRKDTFRSAGKGLSVLAFECFALLPPSIDPKSRIALPIRSDTHSKQNCFGFLDIRSIS